MAYFISDTVDAPDPKTIGRRLHDDLVFRMLGAGNFPKHHTIRDFRALHLLELSELLGGAATSAWSRRRRPKYRQAFKPRAPWP